MERRGEGEEEASNSLKQPQTGSKIWTQCTLVPFLGDI